MSKDVAKKFRVVIDGGDLRVSWPWDRLNAGIASVFALIVATGGVAFAGSQWPSPLGLLGAPVTLAGLYTVVACWVNRMTIFLTPAQLALRSGPLPFPWMSATFARADVRDVETFVSKSTNSKGQTSTSYNFVVIDRRGERNHVVSDDELDVRFLVQTVAAHLRRKA